MADLSSWLPQLPFMAKACLVLGKAEYVNLLVIWTYLNPHPHQQIHQQRQILSFKRMCSWCVASGGWSRSMGPKHSWEFIIGKLHRGQIFDTECVQLYEISTATKVFGSHPGRMDMVNQDFYEWRHGAERIHAFPHFANALWICHSQKKQEPSAIRALQAPWAENVSVFQMVWLSHMVLIPCEFCMLHHHIIPVVLFAVWTRSSKDSATEAMSQCHFDYWRVRKFLLGSQFYLVALKVFHHSFIVQMSPSSLSLVWHCHSSHSTTASAADSYRPKHPCQFTGVMVTNSCSALWELYCWRHCLGIPSSPSLSLSPAHFNS